MGSILLIAFVIMLFLGIPIAVSMAFSTMIAILITGNYSTLAITFKLMAGVESYVLIAIPFFILAGNIMNTGGITTRIFRFANTLVGRIPGGMGHANVVANIIVSGMSGSAVADAGGLGQIIIKAMHDEGFDDEFSSALTCASATIGPIIPPSIPLVVFGAMAEVSVGALFLGGFLPGLLLGLSTMIYVFIVSKRRGYPIRTKMTGEAVWISFKEAFWPSLTPILIIGGILTGVVTPTESAVIATFYALLLSLIYKEMTWARLGKVLLETVTMSSTIIFIIASASAFSWVIAVEGIPQMVTSFILSVTTNKILIILLLNIILLIMGMFMEGLSILTIIVPFLLPIMHVLGLNPVHMGVMVVLNLMIGLSTPPVGLSLFVVSKIANVKLQAIYKEIYPMLVPLILVLIAISYVPPIVTFIPNLFW